MSYVPILDMCCLRNVGAALLDYAQTSGKIYVKSG